MITGGISRLDKLPEPSKELPYDTVYYRLGCAGCEDAVCFSSKLEKGVRSYDDPSKEIKDLVPANTEVHRTYTGIMPAACEEPGSDCMYAEELAFAGEYIENLIDRQE